MGLSRNKVAVSEGAAGSPPFYGESSQREISRDNSIRETKNCPSHSRTEKKYEYEANSKVNRCSIFRVRKRNPEKLKSYGGVAQLGEHLPCKQGVKSSNLFISTSVCESYEKSGDPIGKNTERAHSSAG